MTDGAPDVNRHMARTTAYADWHAALPDGADDPKRLNQKDADA